MAFRYDPPFSSINVPTWAYAGRLDANGNQVEDSEGNQVKPYGRAWDDLAKAYREKHPWCERCLKKGKHVKAALVHHKKYVTAGGKDETANMEALCHSCHEYEHKRHKDERFDMKEETAMDEIKAAEERLRRYERELYRGRKAAEDAADEVEPETVEEALERLKAREAHAYEQEV